jgi:hypothetical protein
MPERADLPDEVPEIDAAQGNPPSSPEEDEIDPQTRGVPSREDTADESGSD